ncbi:hypothetical protein BASA81_002216 [Batrachochytrium salamandrivorans]|nr:hypothetical protein BASA81_002216 [Batrachochytrium salamandrivorans]
MAQDDAKLRVMNRLTEKLLEEKQHLEQSLVELTTELENEQRCRQQDGEFFLQEKQRLRQDFSSQLEQATFRQNQVKEEEKLRAEQRLLDRMQEFTHKQVGVESEWKTRCLALERELKEKSDEAGKVQRQLSASLAVAKPEDSELQRLLAKAKAELEPLRVQVDRLNEQLDEERRLQVQVKQQLDNELGVKYLASQQKVANLELEIASIQEEFVLARRDLEQSFAVREQALLGEVALERQSKVQLEQDHVKQVEADRLSMNQIAREQQQRQVSSLNQYELAIQELRRECGEKDLLLAAQHQTAGLEAKQSKRDLVLAQDESIVLQQKLNSVELEHASKLEEQSSLSLKQTKRLKDQIAALELQVRETHQAHANSADEQQRVLVGQLQVETDRAASAEREVTALQQQLANQNSKWELELNGERASTLQLMAQVQSLQLELESMKRESVVQLEKQAEQLQQHLNSTVMSLQLELEEARQQQQQLAATTSNGNAEESLETLQQQMEQLRIQQASEKQLLAEEKAHVVSANEQLELVRSKSLQLETANEMLKQANLLFVSEVALLRQDLEGDREALQVMGNKLEQAKLQVEQLEQARALASEVADQQHLEAFTHVQEANVKLNQELLSDREALQHLGAKLQLATEQLLEKDRVLDQVKLDQGKSVDAQAKLQKELDKTKDRLFIVEKSRKSLEEEERARDDKDKSRLQDLDSLRTLNGRLMTNTKELEQKLAEAVKERDALQSATGNNVIVSRLQQQIVQDTALAKIRTEQLEQAQRDLKEAHSQLDDLVMESSKLGKRLNEEQRKCTAAKEELEQVKKRNQQDLEDAAAPSIRLGQKLMGLTEQLDEERARAIQLELEIEALKKRASVMESSNV